MPFSDLRRHCVRMVKHAGRTPLHVKFFEKTWCFSNRILGVCMHTHCTHVEVGEPPPGVSCLVPLCSWESELISLSG